MSRAFSRAELLMRARRIREELSVLPAREPEWNVPPVKVAADWDRYLFEPYARRKQRREDQAREGSRA